MKQTMINFINAHVYKDLQQVKDIVLFNVAYGSMTPIEAEEVLLAAHSVYAPPVETLPYEPVEGEGL